ncbi:hypothetical protein VTJ04DRAFT_8632 [Mycothermus thermophilus]|uniref:uncharacterized protein n=1 Tax=Humicola insolens TaxID=85995 RepID=UPI003742E9BB
MSETVLSTLCGICHSKPPKYKCPRCGARTCSLPCVQKHKARADCNGKRNPAAFIPLNRLKTDAGIDHDYNFLTSIERARQLAEKDVVEERRLLTEKELHPPNEDEYFRKVWKGDDLLHLPVQPHKHPYKKPFGEDGPAVTDGFDRHVRHRLRQLDIKVIRAPQGLARHKANKTAFNRRTQTINWQVEWLVFDASRLDILALRNQETSPLRILQKTLEGEPLHQGLAAAITWRCNHLDRQSREAQEPAEDEADPDESPRKRRKTHHKSKPNQQSRFCQHASSSAWFNPAPSTFQSPFTSAWSTTTPTAQITFPLEEQLATWRFYLVKHAVPEPKPISNFPIKAEQLISNNNKNRCTTLLQLQPTSNLTDALSGRTIVEFPTVLVMPPGGVIPDGYAVGDWPRRTPEEQSNGATFGRYPGSHNDNNNDGAGKKRPFASTTRGGRGGKFGGTAGAAGRGQKRAKLGNGEVSRRPGGNREPQSDDEDGGDDAEEGEVDSDGEDVVVKRDLAGADVQEESAEESSSSSESESDSSSSSEDDSDEDSDSDREEADEDGEIKEEGGDVQKEEEDEDEAPPEEQSTRKPVAGLVDYGSSDEE